MALRPENSVILNGDAEESLRRLIYEVALESSKFDTIWVQNDNRASSSIMGPDRDLLKSGDDKHGY
ncbi:hypothetical protein CRYUN_Cryun38cG0045500 [Craigia yunnanensis]